jgi:hypothetical protein
MGCINRKSAQQRSLQTSVPTVHQNQSVSSQLRPADGQTELLKCFHFTRSVRKYTKIWKTNTRAFRTKCVASIMLMNLYASRLLTVLITLPKVLTPTGLQLTRSYATYCTRSTGSARVFVSHQDQRGCHLYTVSHKPEPGVLLEVRPKTTQSACYSALI